MRAKNATKLLDRSVKRQQRGKGSRKHSAGKEWRADKAVHSIAFSVGGNRLSRLACPANNRERERGKLTRRKTHNNHRLCAYFSRAWPSDGTGVPLPLGNIVLCRRSPPSLSFFYFICQIIAAATLSAHSNRTAFAQTRRLNRAWSAEGKRRGQSRD